MTRRSRFLVVLLASAALSPSQGADFSFRGGAGTGFTARPTSTFERLLPLAFAGDPQVQNFVGFMFFYGDGVDQDFEEAHTWFYESARQGNINAQLNLGLFHSGTLPQVPASYTDLEEAAIWLQRAAANGTARAAVESTAIRKGELDIGRKVYVTFCSGCHGMTGIAVRPGAPSFARGGRLTQSDYELAHSIVGGKNSMPPWGATLSRELLDAGLAYLRTTSHPTEVAPNDNVGQRLPPPERVDYERAARDYRTYCAGCHGFNGIPYYANSPSFALGERLEKPDAVLYRSIAKGKGIMPSWEMMLSGAQIAGIVSFIRTLNQAYRRGIGVEMSKPSPHYFRFRPLGETGDEWLGADPAGSIPPSR